MRNTIKFIINKKHDTTFKVLCFLLTFFVFFTLPQTTFANDLFTVRKIYVDVSASSATEAKEKALEDGRKRALSTIFKRLVKSNETESLPEIAPEQIIDMVRDVSISDERVSSVRYIANLTFSFNPEYIKNALTEAGLAFTLERSKPVVILPVFKASRNAPNSLWEETNAWRNSWNANLPENHFVPLIIPYGDLSDITLITAEQSLNLDSNALRAIASNYSTDTVYIAHATAYGGIEARIEISLKKFDVNNISDVSEEPLITIYQTTGMNLNQTLRNAVLKISHHIEDSWKDSKAIQFAIDSTMIVVAKTGALSELNSIEKNLRSIPLVRNIELQATTHDTAQFIMSFAGGIENLEKALSRKNYSLYSSSGYWVLEAKKEITPVIFEDESVSYYGID